MKVIAKTIIDKLIERREMNEIYMKLYANCLIFLAKNCESKDDMK